MKRKEVQQTDLRANVRRTPLYKGVYKGGDKRKKVTTQNLTTKDEKRERVSRLLCALLPLLAQLLTRHKTNKVT
eukprot:4381228-Pyramimonas_sp.AAC.1